MDDHRAEAIDTALDVACEYERMAHEHWRNVPTSHAAAIAHAHVWLRHALRLEAGEQGR